jgi:2-polyprenyl-3-methyl-5-hydroxy-6-metoxy-1,4-benzoquinol methylase
MDLGCGAGIISRMIAEITETTENLCGVDLSDVRIKQAQLMNSSINYHINDITKLDKQESSLDVIFCMVTLMHLSEREQISKVLQWIYNSLRPGGYFIWLEENAKDHYKPLPNADGWGFSLNQMEELTQMVGLKQKRRYKLYKNIFCRLHSLFLREKIPNWIVRISELFLPGSPGSNLVVFQKIM